MEQKKILMMIAQKDYRDEEYDIPKEIFEKTGYQVVTASERQGEARGKLDGTAFADTTFEAANVHDFDAIVLVGGPGMEHYFFDEELLNTVRDGLRENKIIGAICISPKILGNLGALNGKHATGTPSIQNDLIQSGARFTGAPVEADGNIITASGPEAAKEFAEKIVSLLEK